jgi:hypothetical protein
MANAIARRAALALLFAAPLLAQTRRLQAVDESRRDPSLVAYLAKLKDAVAKEDRSVLLPLVHPQIKLGFGGDDGIANFRPDWPLLRRLLAMGGAWQGDLFSLPYVFAKFPEDLDAFDYAAITGKGVWLRERPSIDSRGLRQLSYDIVKVDDQGEAWWKVQTLNGARGYVSSRFIASPVGYRAIFQKNERGEWKMFALLAGD